MGFRDQRATLEERLRTNAEAARGAEREIAELEAEIDARRGAARRVQLAIGSRAVTILAVAGCVGFIVLKAHRSASAAKAEGDRARQALMNERNAVVREIWRLEERAEDVDEEGSRGSPGTAELYETIGRLDCDEERDAWLIVGAAACSIGVQKTRAAAAEALAEGDEDQLDRLCEGVTLP